jgi:hypothetical protein
MKSKLKEINSQKHKLKNKPSLVSIEAEHHEGAERGSHDEGSLKVVEDVVGMLIDEAEHSGSCKCL